MSHRDASHESIGEHSERGQQRDSGGAGGTAGKLSGYVRKGARSGALAGLGGGATVVRGLRSIRAGHRARGVARLAVGAGLLAIAVVQRRSRRDRGERIDIEQSDVVDTSPDIESAASESGSQPDHAGGEEASSVVDTGPDIEDAVADQPEEVEQAESTAETDESGESADDVVPLADDRLGAAAFDEHSNKVPAPQRAFNQEFLSMNAEVVWGIRDDDAVVVSQLYDPIEDGDDVRYVASTQVTEDRLVTVPDEVLDHWESVYDGVRVAGGDDIVFATGDELERNEQLLVVPEAYTDGVVSDDA
ncbi:hypothetical protein [Halosimplex amylolyticum]|uniref:hypothetical protein n=1 Tax=Halosimplex amylolyticum TaxID=3396616 RepID=UPI003F57003A